MSALDNDDDERTYKGCLTLNCCVGLVLVSICHVHMRLYNYKHFIYKIIPDYTVVWWSYYFYNSRNLGTGESL